MKKKELEKEYLRFVNKYYNLLSVVVVFLFLSSGIVCFIALRNFPWHKQESYSINGSLPSEILDIEYNISDEDIRYFKGVINQINPVFLTNQKKLFVRYSIADVCDKCSNYWGLNKNDGEEIYIVFTRDEDRLKRTISHEFMHTYMYHDGGDSPIHKVVYALGDQEVAFK